MDLSIKIKSVVDRLFTGISVKKRTSPTDTKERLRSLANLTGSSLRYKPDVIFDLLGRQTEKLKDSLETLELHINNILEGLEDVGRKPKAIANTKHLNAAMNTITNMKAGLEKSGNMSPGNRSAYNRSLMLYVEQLKPSFSEGTTIRRSGAEAQSLVTDSLEWLVKLYPNIVSSIPLLISAIDDYMASGAGVRSAYVLLERVEEEIASIQKIHDASTPQTRGNTALDDFIKLMSCADVMSHLYTLVDPTTSKMSVGSIRARIPTTPGEITTTNSAPYHLTDSTNSLQVKVDGGTPQTFTLPTSTSAFLRSIVDPSYVLTGSTAATVAATITGTYNVPVRSNDTDMVSTSGSKLFTSVAGGFVTDVQVGDYVVLSGTLTMTGYVVSIIDDNTLLLDTASGSSQVGITYNIHRDNRFRIIIDGTLYTVPLTVGAAVPASTWDTELSAVITNATVDVPGGLLTITATTAGISPGGNSRIFVFAGEIVTLLGMTAGIYEGTMNNTSLGVQTESGTDNLSLTASTYTTSTLVTHINGLLPSYCTAYNDGGRIALKSKTSGERSWVKITTENLALGFVKDAKATNGSYVSLADIARHIEDNKTIAISTRTQSDTLASGSCAKSITTAVVTDSTVDFIALGVGVGDTATILDGADRGHYRISARTTTTLTLTGLVAADSDTVQYRVERNRLTISSLSTAITSSVNIPAASTSDTEMGLDNTDHLGTTQKLEVYNGSVLDLGEYELTTNDTVYDGTTYNNITEVGEYYVTVETPVLGTYTDSTYNVYSKSALAYLSLKAALQTWTSTELSKLIFDQTNLDNLRSVVLRAVSSPTPVYIGEATSAVNLLSTVLFGVTTGLKTILSAYTPLRLEETDALLDMLRQERADRMLDLLVSGRFSEAFALDETQANYLSYIQTTLHQTTISYGASEPRVIGGYASLEDLDDTE